MSQPIIREAAMVAGLLPLLTEAKRATVADLQMIQQCDDAA